MLTRDRVLEALAYEPQTGVFRWRISPGRRVRPGKVAGSLNAKGHRFIQLDGERHAAHRLAWLIVKGVWPTDEIDHRDLNKDNNSIGNLREATRPQNVANTPIRSDNSSGVKGVHFHCKRGKWCAVIGVNGRKIHVGDFDTLEAAAEARAKAANDLHKEFARTA